MTPLLSIQSVTKDFGYKRILKKVSFDLNPNDFTLLLGKNGAGKSTLLTLLSGLMRPTQGCIFFDGKSVQEDYNPLRNAIGQIRHTPQVYGDLTAKENLIFFARLRHLDHPAERAAQALKKVELDRFAHAQVKNFSSGMFKRIGIARLMMSEPRLLLLDEPYTGLDYKSVDFFNRYLREFTAQGGSVLMVTHQLDCCFEQATKIAILDQGVIDSEQARSQFNYQELIEHYQRATQ